MKIGIIGLGAMGAATARAAAIDGHEVIGFDAHRPPHDIGSSHGLSRVTRVAYHESPVYVPMARRAQAAWRELEVATGHSLMTTTGALLVGGQDGEVVPGLRAAAKAHALRIDDPGVAALQARWPMLRIQGLDAAVEPAGGVLDPEGCIEALLADAVAHGARLRFDTPVTAWQGGAKPCIETGQIRHDVDAIVVAGGPWMVDVCPGLPLVVQRRVQHWFRTSDAFDESRFPAFMVEPPQGPVFYGVPARDGIIKIALHVGPGLGEATHPDTVKRTIDAREPEQMAALANTYFDGMAGAHVHSSVCLYTMSPDGHFIIDRHPEQDHVVVLAGFSGHGFKFAPVVGEVAARLAAGQAPGYDLSPFALARFAKD